MSYIASISEIHNTKSRFFFKKISSPYCLFHFVPIMHKLLDSNTRRHRGPAPKRVLWSMLVGTQKVRKQRQKNTKSPGKVRSHLRDKNIQKTQKQSLDTGTRTRKTQDVRQRWGQWDTGAIASKGAKPGWKLFFEYHIYEQPLSSLRRLKGKTHLTL